MKKKSSTQPVVTNEIHQQAEQTLESNARHLQQLFDEMASGFSLHEIICDKHGKPVDYRFLEMNPAFERLTGLVAKDIIGNSALEIIPGLEPFWIETYGRVALTGQPARFENYSQALDKTFSVIAYSPQHGQFAVLFEDVTERKQAEKKLSASESRYSALVETAQDLIWQCDTEGRYTYLNPAWEEVFGYKLEEMLGKRFVDFQTPEYAKKDMQEFKRLLKGDLVKGLETVHLGKDGRQIHLIFNAKQLVDADGQPVGTQGTAYDITWRKQTEELLIQRNQDLELLNAINVAVNDGANLEEVFNLISAKLKVLFHCFGATVNLVNKDRTRLVMQNLIIPSWLKKNIEKLTGVKIPRIEHDLEADHPYNQVFTSGKSQLITNMEAIQEFTKGFIRSLNVPDKARSRLEGLVPAITKLIDRRSVMVVPMVSNDAIIGTLDVGGQDLFNQEDLHRLEAIAASLTAVIQRKNADEELFANEEKYRSLFNYMSEGVAINELIMDENGKVVDYIILDVNAAFEINTPYKARDVIGKRATDVYQYSQEFIKTWWQQHVSMGSTAYTELYHEPSQHWHAITTTKPVSKRFYTIFSDITERKLAEKKLQESAGNMQAILDANMDSVFLLEPDGTIVAANLGQGNLFGRSREGLVGSNTYDLLPPEVADYRRKFMDQVIASGKPVRFEDDRDGITIENSIYPVLDEHGKVIRLTIFGRDVSERKKAERSLAESEERFRLMIENAPLGYQSLDIEGNFIHVNPAWLEILGYEREEIIGHWFGDFLAPEYRDAFRERFPIFKAAGQIHSEFEMLHKNGSSIFVAFEGRIGNNATGEFKQTHCMIQDITEKRRTEDRILQSETELKKAQSYAHVGSWIWNVKDGNLEWSDEMYNIFGISKESFSGNLDEVVANAIHPDDREKVDKSNASVANEGKTIPLEYRILHPDGSQRVVWAEAGELELDEEGKPALLRGIVMDITERKQAEEALQESERRYRERATELETIMDIAPVALWMAQDPACHVITGNRTANELHKIRPDQNASMTPVEGQKPPPNQVRIIHNGVEIAPTELPLQVCASQGIEIRNFESQIEFDDGSFIYEIGNAKPLLDENGQPRGAVGAFMDITGLKHVEEELRRRAEELDALQKTVLDITTAQSLPDLLESIVERACQLVGAPGGGLYQTDPVKQEVRCDVSFNTPGNYIGVVLKYGEGVAGKVAQTGKPFLIDDYKSWAGRAHNFEVEKPFSTVLGVPLLWGGQVNGVIDVLHYEEGKTFTQADMDLLKIFAGHAAIAIENGRLLEASQAGEAEVRALSARLADAEENERRRIARELHDQVGQSLSALSINMNIMSSQVPQYLPGFKRRLDDSLMLIDQTTDHIRNLMSELRPAVLDDYGLRAALDWAAGSVTSRTNLKLLVEGECNRFPPRVEIALFRIAQEALGNISRHASARNVKILVTQDGPDMSMSITDDGVGFDPSAVAATDKSGWGLRLMAERAESIGASLQVESAHGKGTIITARYHDKNSTGG